jgi:PAS domain S-box-containing protein
MSDRLKLLVVDDVDADAWLVVDELQRAGYACDCHRARTTDEMQAALAGGEWDLVVSDANLPGDGPLPLEIYRLSGLDAPFIIVSGFVGEEAAVELMRSGAHDVVPKDHLIRLPQAVRRELREARARAERRRAEDVLRQSEERYRKLFEETNDAIFVIESRTGRFLDANRAAERLAGRPVHELRKLTTAHVTPGASLPRLDELASAGGRAQDYGEVEYLQPDGTARTATLSVVRIDDDSVYGIAHDITDRKRAEEALRRSEEELRQALRVESVGRLAAGVAHDFNNLLSPILGYSELLLQDFHPSDERYSQIREIEQAAKRARDLTRQLLAFGRKQTLQIQPVDLDTVVAGMERLMRRTLREDVELTVVRSGAPVVVLADTGQVEQVLMNLVVNAQDAMPGGGSLAIAIAASRLDEADCAGRPGCAAGEYGVLVVADTGTGMDEATRQRIFEPFFSTKGERGTGLGLSTVYGIVTQHGGHVWVDSEVGRGTTFRAFFPSTAAAATVDARPDTAAAGPRGSETVLLVEDNDAVRHLAQTVLQREGYHVLSASGGQEALDLLAGHDGPVHLLLTDVVMSGMDGRTLFERVAGRSPNLKAIFMSGYADDVIEHRGVLGEHVHFVQKPFSVAALTQTVREVLGAGR